MKKVMVLLAVFVAALSVFAGPPRGRDGSRPCPPRHSPPPPPRHGGYWRHDYHGSSGVRLAADIVGLVGNSIGVVNALTPRTTVVVPAQPAVVQPVIQPVPVVQQPVVQQPAPAVNQTVIIQQPAQKPAQQPAGRAYGYDPHGYNLP